MADAPVIPLTLTGIGLYLAWFGIHYWRSDVRWPTDPVKSVLQGKGLPATNKPESFDAQLTSEVSSASAQESTGGGGGPGTTTPTQQASGNAIADDALTYVGQGYVWGGKADKPGDWDCSSFVSYVLGHDLGLPLPGGHWGDPGYPPNSHGPTTIQYLTYGTPLNNISVAAGDLVVYQTHMGIATSNSEMVSARSPQDGTGVNKIADMTSSLGEIPFFRKVPGSPGTATGTTQAPGTTTAGGRGLWLTPRSFRSPLPASAST